MKPMTNREMWFLFLGLIMGVVSSHIAFDKYLELLGFLILFSIATIITLIIFKLDKIKQFKLRG